MPDIFWDPPRVALFDVVGVEDVTGSEVNVEGSGNAQDRAHYAVVKADRIADVPIAGQVAIDHGSAGPDDVQLVGSGEFTIPAGAQFALVALKSVADFLVEGVQTAVMRLTDVVNALIDRGEAALVLHDNDLSPAAANEIVTGQYAEPSTGYLEDDHTAIDLPANLARAGVFGEVVHVDSEDQYFEGKNIGRYVSIRLPAVEGDEDGATLVHLHVTVPYVVVGQLVDPTTIIGETGPTAYPGHDHVFSRIDGQVRDPARAATTAEEGTHQDPTIPIALAASQIQLEANVASGNTLAEATPLGVLEPGSREVYTAMSAASPTQWYSLFLTEPTNLALRVSHNEGGLAAEAVSLHVYDAEGRELASSVPGDTNLDDGATVSDRWEGRVAAGLVRVEIRYGGEVEVPSAVRLRLHHPPAADA